MSLSTQFGAGATLREDREEDEGKPYSRRQVEDLLALKGDKSLSHNHELRIVDLEKRIKVIEDILNIL